MIFSKCVKVWISPVILAIVLGMIAVSSIPICKSSRETVVIIGTNGEGTESVYAVSMILNYPEYKISIAGDEGILREPQIKVLEGFTLVPVLDAPAAGRDDGDFVRIGVICVDQENGCKGPLDIVELHFQNSDDAPQLSDFDLQYRPVDAFGRDIEDEESIFKVF